MNKSQITQIFAEQSFSGKITSILWIKKFAWLKGIRTYNEWMKIRCYLKNTITNKLKWLMEMYAHLPSANIFRPEGVQWCEPNIRERPSLTLVCTVLLQNVNEKLWDTEEWLLLHSTVHQSEEDSNKKTNQISFTWRDYTYICLVRFVCSVQT